MNIDSTTCARTSAKAGTSRRVHPEKVKELDQLIEDYIAEANVVVPLPNPKFDPVKFDPSKIGVQAGGFEDASRNVSGKAGQAATVTKRIPVGMDRQCADVAEAGLLRITATGRQSLLVNSKIQS